MHFTVYNGLCRLGTRCYEASPLVAWDKIRFYALSGYVVEW
jgi:hypothetical protein